MHGLEKRSVKINKKELLHIINGWAREAGVRNLERQLEKICRKMSVYAARGEKLPAKPLDAKAIRNYLGLEMYTDDEIIKTSKPGIAIGLAWTSHGGAALVVESIAVARKKNEKGFTITGQLGDVMSESAEIAYSYIQHYLSGSSEFSDFFSNNIIHLHVPAGATPKDGPSAGITIASSIYSVITRKSIKSGIAMTGELTLSGRIYPVGGIKEKIIAAKRTKIRKIILPEENSKDLSEIPEYIKKGLNFYPVKDMQEVLNILFG